jgi:putative iron-dependent peroxidase
LQIVRDNMPFGNIGKGEFSTYFIGYARSPRRIEAMLENMFVGNLPGSYDDLLDFSRATTGTLFFVPTANFLDDVSEDTAPAAADPAPDEPKADKPARSPSVARDGSLGIGSLKEEAEHE